MISRTPNEKPLDYIIIEASPYLTQDFIGYVILYAYCIIYLYLNTEILYSLIMCNKKSNIFSSHIADGSIIWMVPHEQTSKGNVDVRRFLWFW